MQRFKNILVVMNQDGLADVVLARAQWLAQTNDAVLTLLTVQDRPSVDIEWLVSALPGGNAKEFGHQVQAALQDEMRVVADDLEAKGVSVNTAITTGVSFVETIRQVIVGRHDLVIKGAEQSFDWRTFGGRDLHLLRKCPCPVWILNNGTEPHARRIMAAVDPDPEDDIRDALNQKVMQLATSLAVQDHARLDVLNAWYLYEEHLLRGRRGMTSPEEVDALLEKTRHKSRWRLDQLTTPFTAVTPDMEVIHIKGLPDEVIVNHAREQRIDTLVMGTLGRAGLPGMFIGNTAETVLNRVECSVLAVKPENFVSPVKV